MEAYGRQSAVKSKAKSFAGFGSRRGMPRKYAGAVSSAGSAWLNRDFVIAQLLIETNSQPLLRVPFGEVSNHLEGQRHTLLFRLVLDLFPCAVVPYLFE
jgi:hypothetical protein